MDEGFPPYLLSSSSHLLVESKVLRVSSCFCKPLEKHVVSATNIRSTTKPFELKVSHASISIISYRKVFAIRESIGDTASSSSSAAARPLALGAKCSAAPLVAAVELLSKNCAPLLACMAELRPLPVLSPYLLAALSSAHGAWQWVLRSGWSGSARCTGSTASSGRRTHAARSRRGRARHGSRTPHSRSRASATPHRPNGSISTSSHRFYF